MAKTSLAEKRELLDSLLGGKGLTDLYLSRRNAEFLGADAFCYAYFYIDGDFDHKAFERVVGVVKRRGFSMKRIYVIADGFELYQSQLIRFYKASDLRRYPRMEAGS